MNIDTTLQKLFSLHQFHIKLGLERIEQLLKFTGNPQNNLKCFHIAGSNGKGSTASFIASILMEAGFKVGLYTSPHFKRFNERIRINGNEIEDSYIINYMDSIESFIENNQPTFFEITTGMAFKYFSDNKVDYAVIETGLGGRLDATNTIIPEAAVITSISYEHTNILGNSLSEIAEEKAGIIKNGIKVFIGSLPHEAEMRFKRSAEEKKCELFILNKFVKQSEESVSLMIKDKNYNIYSTGLVGYHQLKNASLAVKTINEVLGIDNDLIFNKGLKDVIANSGIQGRYEIFYKRPRIIFDAAHNVDGVQVFIREFEKEYTAYSERNLIFGAMRDKNIEEMLKIVSPFFDNIYITSANYERSAKIEEIHEIAKKLNIKTNSLVNPEEEILRMIKKGGNECLAVIGSIYLIGEIKLKIENNS